MRNFTSGLLAAIILLAAGIQAQAQKVTTIVGTGNEGYSGDKGSALSAKLHWPQGLALDKSGRILYIADAFNNCIRKVDEAGKITTIAGTAFLAGTGGGVYGGDGGPATAADFHGPTGLAIDTAGNIFVADAGNNCVRKIDKAGIVHLVAGTVGVSGYSGDGAAATGAKLSTPARIAVDTFGNLYIADVQNNRIRKVDATGTISTFAGSPASGYTGDGGPAISATLMQPSDVVVSIRDTSVYIADESNFCIRKVDKAGVITTYAGTGIPAYTGDSAAATAARMYDPAGLALDDSANLYISDRGNDCVRMVNRKDGKIYTIAGMADSAGYAGDGGPALSARFDYLQGLAVNHKGSVYIADMNNNRIRLLAYKAEGVSKVNNVYASINIYPNPGAGSFIVNMKSDLNETAVITIGNVAGEKVYQGTMLTNKPNTIQLKNPPGIYMLYATTAHGTWTQKLVIE